MHERLGIPARPKEAGRTLDRKLTRDEAGKEIILDGFLKHETAHDRGPEKKVYHVLAHPKVVEQRAMRLADVMQLSEDQKLIARMAIAFHDVVIKVTYPPPYDPAQPKTMLGMAQRMRGAREGDQPAGVLGNEALSANLLVQKMQEANAAAAATLFSEDDMQIVRLAIEYTYPAAEVGGPPDFDGIPFTSHAEYYREVIQANPDIQELLENLHSSGITKGPLFRQPHLEAMLDRGERVPPEALIVAIADLGAAGMGTSEDFFNEGDREFLEIHPNLADLRVQARLRSAEGAPERALVAGDMLKWLDGQAGFSAWQAIRVGKIRMQMQSFGDIYSMRNENLHNAVGRFKENASSAAIRAGERTRAYHDRAATDERIAFIQLADAMGYTIEKNE
ncbi:hypothetical protein C4568_00860 [Candidatus Parcubacteria bacterium]|nr:MAG: hypothetical protein C4568_00860 [Candidatus Parcubacteria bacterium]